TTHCERSPHATAQRSRSSTSTDLVIASEMQAPFRRLTSFSGCALSRLRSRRSRQSNRQASTRLLFLFFRVDFDSPTATLYNSKNALANHKDRILSWHCYTPQNEDPFPPVARLFFP